MVKNKKKQIKIVIEGYDVGNTDAATKLMHNKLTQLKLVSPIPHPVSFPNQRIVVSTLTSPHKHKDAQERYQQITHRRKFFVTISDNFTPSILQSLLKTRLEMSRKVNLRFVFPSEDK